MNQKPFDHSQRLNRVIAEYLEAVETGTPLDREELLDTHRELAEDLQSFFAEHDRMRSAAGHREAATQPTATTGEDATLPPQHGQDDPTLAPAAGSSDITQVDTRVRYFGDYELLEEIARGGMGVVYKAKQTSLNRIVALKMILAGQLASDEDVQRFHAEAEAAANLDHPGIVPIYEIGEHEGQHYFSMGYVDGKSLAEKIKDGPLPPRDAAKYTCKVAEAIAFAHARKVIHRDLKPGNVLIDRSGEPKVTDFGLAKRIEGDSNLTATGQILGTPSYMPPEQASGKVDEVTEAADVYSLGAVLYALLTGRPPFQSDSSLDTLLQVLEQEPVSPRVLNPKVPQDLETICLKSLQKDVRHRYVSSKELSDELNRFLNGEPIHARPVGAAERAWRWCRRKPIVASLIAATAGSLVAGILVSSYFAVLAARRADDAVLAKEETERALKAESQARSRVQQSLVAETLAKNQARRAVDNYVDLVTTDEALSERRFQPLRRRLLGDALSYYQWLSESSRANEANQLELAEAYQNLGRVHLFSGSAGQGYQSLQEAVKILKKLSNEDPPVDEAGQQLPIALNLLAQLALELSRTSEAIEYYHQAIEIDQDLAERSPDDHEQLSQLAADYNNLGEAHRHVANVQAAEQCFQKAIDIKQQLVDADPKSERWLEALGNSYNNLGILKIADDRRREEALDAAIEIREQLVKQQPGNPKYRDSLASSYFNRGNFKRHPGDALEAYEKARILHEQLLQEDPNVLRYRFSLAKDLLNAAEASIRIQDAPRAETYLTRSIQLHQQLIAEQPEVPEYQNSLASCHDYVASVCIARGDYPAAREELQQSAAILQRLLQSHPDRMRFQSALAFAYYRLGDLLFNRLQDPQTALEYWRKELTLREHMLSIRPDQTRQHFYVGGSLNNVAMLLEHLGNTSEAAELYEQAASHQRIALAATPQDGQARAFLSNHLAGLSRTHRALGQWSSAVQAAQDLIALWPRDPEGLYRGAAELSCCVQMAEAAKNDEQPPADQQEVDSVRRAVVQTLEKAVAAGFTDSQRLEQDTAWTPLQDDERFSILRKQLADKREE